MMATLGLDSSEYENGLDDAEKTANSKGGSIMGALGGLAKVTGVAIGAAATGVSVLTKASVDAYAEQQQLVGGVQKLYGNMGQSVEEYAESMGKSVDEVRDEWQNLEDAQNLVLENANKAFATAGMSANQYMDIATSFSASLINSLEGDTLKAAEQTDVAMRAISDNFNTFGGDIGMIQGAFQGFAKQNYTMLDNLKLGYGGTKQEMERLIADANEYAASIGEASDLSIDSFSDIVTAIDLIQQKQNIAGTTSREAASTISGSIGSIKAAWENLVAGLSSPDADLGVLISNVVDSASTAFENLIPTIEQALSGVSDLIGKIAPILAEKLPEILDQLLPSVLSAAVSLVDAVVAALPDILKVLVDQIPVILSELSGSFVSIVGVLSQGLIDLVVDVVNDLAEMLPTLISVIVDAVLTIADVLTDPANLNNLIDAGVALLDALVQGVMDAIPRLLEAVPRIVISLVNAVPGIVDKLMSAIQRNLSKIVQGAVDLVKGLVQALPSIITALLDALPLVLMSIVDTLVELLPVLVDGVVQLVVALADALPDIIMAIVDALPTLIQVIINALEELIPAIVEGLVVLTIAIAEHLPEIIQALVNALPLVVSAIVDGLRPLVTNVLALFGELFSSIGGLISSWWTQKKTEIANGWNTFITSVKEWFAQLPYNLGYALADMFLKLVEWLSDALNWVTNDVPELIESFVKWFLDLPERIGEFFAQILTDFVTWAGDFLKSVLEEIPKITDSIADFFKDLVDKAWTWGVDLIQNFIDGIRNMASQAWDAVEDFAQGIADRLGFSEPKTGPLSNFHTYAPDMVDLFISGVKSNEKRLHDQIEDSFDFSGYINDFETNGSVNTSVNLGGAGNLITPTVGRDVTVILELDKTKFAKTVFRLNEDETQRLGVALANV